MKKVTIYLRVSKEQDQIYQVSIQQKWDGNVNDDSLENQRDSFLQYVLEKGWRMSP